MFSVFDHTSIKFESDVLINLLLSNLTKFERTLAFVAYELSD